MEGLTLFVITDIFSGLRAAYPAPDKSANSTTMAIITFAGMRVIHKLYAGRSVDISRALENLDIMPQGSQPGVPQTNAVAERANGDVLGGHSLSSTCCWFTALLLGICNEVLLSFG